MIDFAIYIVLVGIIVTQGFIIKARNKQIKTLKLITEAVRIRLESKQKKYDDLKMRFIAENTMVRRKN